MIGIAIQVITLILLIYNMIGMVKKKAHIGWKIAVGFGILVVLFIGELGIIYSLIMLIVWEHHINKKLKKGTRINKFIKISFFLTLIGILLISAVDFIGSFFFALGFIFILLAIISLFIGIFSSYSQGLNKKLR